MITISYTTWETHKCVSKLGPLAKPLPNPRVTYCQLYPQKKNLWNLNRNTMISGTEMQVKNILFRPLCLKTYVLLQISPSFYVSKCRVRFSLVFLSLYGSTTPRAIIPVQHSILGTGWGLHEEKRRDSTTKWYQKYDYQPVPPIRISHNLLKHAILRESVNKISIKICNWDVFLNKYALCMSKVRVPRVWWDVLPGPSGWRRLAGPGQRSTASDGLPSFLHDITTVCHVCWYNIYSMIMDKVYWIKYQW